jgi:hypothetical protein
LNVTTEEKPQMKYVAIIGDIKSSKAIPNRLDFQNSLNDIFKVISIDNKSIVSPYTITLGDEFQALYNSAKGLLTDIIRIMALLYPVRIRFSIGLGDIDTEINPKQALGMDGSAFHIAREGIIRMKNDEISRKAMPSITLNSDSKTQNSLLIDSFNIVSYMLERMSQNQLNILLGVVNNDSIPAIASKMDVSEQAVYKGIRKDAMLLIKDYIISFENEVGKLLK